MGQVAKFMIPPFVNRRYLTAEDRKARHLKTTRLCLSALGRGWRGNSRLLFVFSLQIPDQNHVTIKL